MVDTGEIIIFLSSKLFYNSAIFFFLKNRIPFHLYTLICLEMNKRVLKQ